MTAGRVRLAVGHTRRRVTAFDDLGLPVAVEVGQRRRGEAAVGGEEGPAGQDRPVGRLEGVLLLPEGRSHHRVHAVEIPHGHRCLHAVEAVGIRCILAPHLGSRTAEGVVAADPGLAALPAPTKTCPCHGRPRSPTASSRWEPRRYGPASPATAEPLSRWNAQRLPERSPTTTDGPPPSKVASEGELSAIGPPASGSVCCQVREMGSPTWAEGPAAEAGGAWATPPTRAPPVPRRRVTARTANRRRRARLRRAPTVLSAPGTWFIRMLLCLEFGCGGDGPGSDGRTPPGDRSSLCASTPSGIGRSAPQLNGLPAPSGGYTLPIACPSVP